MTSKEIALDGVLTHARMLINIIDNKSTYTRIDDASYHLNRYLETYDELCKEERDEKS